MFPNQTSTNPGVSHLSLMEVCKVINILAFNWGPTLTIKRQLRALLKMNKSQMTQEPWVPDSFFSPQNQKEKKRERENI